MTTQHGAHNLLVSVCYLDHTMALVTAHLFTLLVVVIVVPSACPVDAASALCASVIEPRRLRKWELQLENKEQMAKSMSPADYRGPPTGGPTAAGGTPTGGPTAAGGEVWRYVRILAKRPIRWVSG